MDNLVRIFCRPVDICGDDRNNRDWKMLFLRNELNKNTNEEKFSLCKEYGNLNIKLDLFDSKTIFHIHPSLGTPLKMKYFSIDVENNIIIPIEESLLKSMRDL